MGERKKGKKQAFAEQLHAICHVMPTLNYHQTSDTEPSTTMGPAVTTEVGNHGVCDFQLSYYHFVLWPRTRGAFTRMVGDGNEMRLPLLKSAGWNSLATLVCINGLFRYRSMWASSPCSVELQVTFSSSVEALPNADQLLKPWNCWANLADQAWLTKLIRA